MQSATVVVVSCQTFFSLLGKPALSIFTGHVGKMSALSLNKVPLMSVLLLMMIEKHQWIHSQTHTCYKYTHTCTDEYASTF